MSSTPSPSRRRRCPLCRRRVCVVDYKDYPLLREYVDYFGNLRRREGTGVCLHHQRQLRVAVERGRFLGMLAYRK